MRPQQPAIAEVKRVMHRARRVIGRNIQRFEIMEVVFDFRPFRYRESRATENFFDPQACPCHRMQGTGMTAAPRQGHIDPAGGQLSGHSSSFQHSLACIDRGRQCVLGLVDTGPRLAADLRAQGAERLQLLGDQALLTQQPHADLIECDQIRGGLDLVKTRGDEACEIHGVTPQRQLPP